MATTPRERPMTFPQFPPAHCCSPPTLFSECLAHGNHPNFPKLLGHPPKPRVILILSNGLESNSQKTLCQNLHITTKTIDFDQLDMTRGHWENWMKSMCTSFGEECKCGISGIPVASPDKTCVLKTIKNNSLEYGREFNSFSFQPVTLQLKQYNYTSYLCEYNVNNQHSLQCHFLFS